MPEQDKTRRCKFALETVCLFAPKRLCCVIGGAIGGSIIIRRPVYGAFLGGK